ncbi:[Protein-PII] uridylyltransferase [Triticum urartu]|uniref:ACT domain-containing protein ACR n=1 Tax=Triticum urartu TaxID=4572 RepID=M8ANV6_TRIUA|nr:[Protein-PII] uridylyltransferase [Triticum urartu]
MACGSRSNEIVDEFEKLVIKMNPPRVTVDNTSDMTATLVKVDSANKYGTLLEVVQVLTDLKLTINRAYISSDGEWFMDVFHVVDEEGNKLYDGQVIDRIEQSLGAGSLSFRGTDRCVGVEAEAEAAQTVIELIGRDRPGLLSEVFAVLTNLNCNIAASEDCAERGYTLVNVRCRDRPKLLFDTVCTLTDMQYLVFHGTVIAEGSEAYQEYYIRHLDDGAAASDQAREQLRRCLEAAIQRRNTEGLGLELCCEDRVGLLSDVTRIFREHGLSVTHAEVATRGERAANVFYVVTASGMPVQAPAVEAVRAEIGDEILLVKEAAAAPKSPPGRDGGGRSLGNMIRSRSEKFLYNLGLIRSCS